MKLALMLFLHDEETGESLPLTNATMVEEAEAILGVPSMSGPDMGFWLLDDVQGGRDAAL